MMDSSESIVAFKATLVSARPAMKQMQEAERLRPPAFNIFKALGHAYREVQTHSAMLAHLLDPAGSHGQELRFLSRFLQITQSAASRQHKTLRLPVPDDTTGWECRREFSLSGGNGQADVILRGPNFLLIIENKILAGDQEGQLTKYWRYLSTARLDGLSKPSGSAHSGRVLVYLTPDGRPPSSVAIMGQSQAEAKSLHESLVRLSYKQDILKLVDPDLERVEAASVAEVLRQYASLLRSF